MGSANTHHMRTAKKSLDDFRVDIEGFRLHFDDLVTERPDFMRRRAEGVDGVCVLHLSRVHIFECWRLCAGGWSGLWWEFIGLLLQSNSRREEVDVQDSTRDRQAEPQRPYDEDEND